MRIFTNSKIPNSESTPDLETDRALVRLKSNGVWVVGDGPPMLLPEGDPADGYGVWWAAKHVNGKWTTWLNYDPRFGVTGTDSPDPDDYMTAE